MNTAVTHGDVIVNVMGIRYVNWGKAVYASSIRPDHPYYVTVVYKGNRETFYFKTVEEAEGLFDKIREAMVKTSLKVK